MKRSNLWLQRQKNDPYVKQAQKNNYRSRAIFKLQEIDQRDRLFKSGQTVVDLGAAPGSWCQYVTERIGSGGRLIAVDLLKMSPIANVEFIHGDFTDEKIFDQCLKITGEDNVDLVISDLAPNLTGIRDTDQARSINLAEHALEFASKTLCAGGSLLIKVFNGRDIDSFRNDLNSIFQRVMVRKPGACRNSSREFYILARGYKI